MQNRPSLYATCSLVLLISSVVLLACEPSSEIVQYRGSLKGMMKKADLSAKVRLDTVQTKNLYALGAEEGLKGEIQIMNGRSFNSFVHRDKVSIDSSFEASAALLVWSYVEEWDSVELKSDLKAIDQLEDYLKALRSEQGHKNSDPFPFLIRGKVEKLKWHVIDWPEDDSDHTHQKHIESGANGLVTDAYVEILGFYSNRHSGIFTHHENSVHMHFINSELQLAGHVDELHLPSGILISVPKNDKNLKS